MNKASLTDLTNKCKDLERRIESEKRRLQDTEEILSEYNGYAEIEEEQKKNRLLEEEILNFRDKVHKMRNEYEDLRTSMQVKEREMEELTLELESKRRRSSALSAEIDIWRCENAKLEKRIQKVRDLNARRELENEKKVEELAKSPDPWMAIHQGRMRSEESTLKEEREKLTQRGKKLEKQIGDLFQAMETLRSECEKREKNANETLYAVQKIVSAERHYIEAGAEDPVLEEPSHHDVAPSSQD